MGIKRETAGYSDWKEIKVFEGKDQSGQMKGREGFRSMTTGQDFVPENGWNGEPPYRIGDLTTRHISKAYRRGYERIQWDR